MNSNSRREQPVALMFAMVMLLAGGSAAAQEATTGAISGQVVDAQGLPIPGATVIVTSPQGDKSFVTDAYTPSRSSCKASGPCRWRT